ncbi:MAG: TonB-dependent receptor [Terracidiphilus sp.]
MRFPLKFAFNILPLSVLFLAALGAAAQSGNAGTVRGTVTDPLGAVIPDATVRLSNDVSGFDHAASSDGAGRFVFSNVPFNPYRITVVAKGFAVLIQSLEIRSSVGVNLKLVLQVAGTSQTVTVEAGGDLIENDPTFHTDVDRGLFDKLPLESESSSLSSLVTLSSPGVAADSNGLFHGLGDHAQNSFSVDGQAITDQQSKVFSNQIPLDSVQSLEVISGAPPAEFGDKTSLVIKVTTRSGLDTPRPTGRLYTSYGSFGSVNTGFNLAAGGKKTGNFLAGNFLDTSRFLDPPEFKVFHDRGNETNVFDRADYRFSTSDTAQLNLGYTRSWFQTPNSFDNLNPAQFNAAVTSGSLPATDQRAKIGTFNVAPTWTHVLNPTAVLNAGAFVRKDQFDYYPSRNPLSDVGPADLQRETVAQSRSLTNLGLHSDLSWNRGAHNVKGGVTYQQTLLRESFGLGIVDPTLNAPCLDANNNPVPGFTDPTQCAAAGYQPNTAANPNATAPFLPLLGCYDLTRPTPAAGDGCAHSVSGNYPFLGRTDVKELALYIQDSITAGNWLFNVGIRGDLYNGLTVARQAEPRVGVSYHVKRTNTVLRVSYARTLETPFNENLVLSSEGCGSAVIKALVPCVPASLPSGFRNEFHAGFQQAAGRYFVVGGDYIWKYTHNSFDFSVLGNTPIFFPIDWHNSKIPGFALNASMPNFHGLSAELVLSSVAARFFPGQVGGLGTTVGQSGLPFRIDHDEKLNQTTHLQYQFAKHGVLNGLWAGWNWRYDSGLVAGAMPFASDSTTPIDLSGLSYDQQFQSGIVCNGVKATPTSGFSSCLPSQYKSSLISIPAPGKENDDHNPPRVASRSLFDASLGQDNIFHADRYKVNLDVTAINVTNKYALYNFLSTFSGTHYVTPRAVSAKITLNF